MILLLGMMQYTTNLQKEKYTSRIKKLLFENIRE